MALPSCHYREKGRSKERLYISSGAGGIRTLVQTRNKIAFYMLSFLLVFVMIPVKNNPNHP